MTNTPTAQAAFQNPFAGLRDGDSEVKRVHIFFPKWMVNYIKCIRPEQSRGSGTVETTFTLLYLKLLNELQRRNISTQVELREFEQFVLNSVLAEPGELTDASKRERAGGPGSTSSSTLPQTETPNVGSGASSGHAKVAEHPAEPTSTTSRISEVSTVRGKGKQRTPNKPV